MIESDHLSRYHWAAQFAAGRRVLDAGCGTAFGTVILSQSAATTTGIDNASEVIDEARARLPEQVRFEVGDVRNLSFEDNSFDLVVCFETIEHIEEPERALDEFRRVLTPDGLLVVSTPNAAVSVKGNPYHVREFTPPELRDVLGSRFAQVTLYRQNTWVASGILNDEGFRTNGGQTLNDVEVRKLPVDELGEEGWTIALAGGELPTNIANLVELNTSVELAAWDAEWHAQRDLIDRQKALLDEQIAHIDAQSLELQQFERQVQQLERQVEELEPLRGGLLEAERELSRLPDLENELKEAMTLLVRLQDIELDRDLWRTRFEVIASSKSWRLTGIFRRAGAAFRKQ